MTSTRHLGWLAVAAVGLLLLVRLLVASGSELFPAESYYWTYSLHPAWGYYDHPPFVAWLARLGTGLLGQTELGVRLGSLLLWVGTCAALWASARLWFGPVAAHWSVLVLVCLPISGAVGLMLLPDAPLWFFWALMMLAVSLAVRRNGWWWLVAGVALGGALLAKYPAILLVPSLLLFLFLAPAHRVWLGRAGPWVTILVGLALFSPVLLWNAQHDWVSLRFQLGRADEAHGTPLANMGLFWGQQLAIASPVIFVWFVWVAVRAVKRGWMGGQPGWAFVGAFGLPLLVLFALASAGSESRPNWTAPAFLALAIGSGALLAEKLAETHPRQRRRWRRLAWVGLGLGGLMVLTGYSVVRFGQPWFLGSNRHGGWRQLAREVEAMRRSLQQPGGPEPFIWGLDRYHLAASLGFYTRRPELTVNWYLLGKPGLAYRYWSNASQWDRRPAVAVVRAGAEEEMALLRRHCDLGPIRTVRFASPSWRPRQYWLVPCWQYHFVMHPLPKTEEARP